MVTLAELWLPILISGIGVFAASSIIWMALPYHKADIKFLSNEKAFDEALARLDIAPGLYMFPNCSDPSQYKSEAYKERFRAGPWGTITIMGRAPSFGANMVKTFITYLIISVLVAYITSTGVPEGAAYMHVFRVAGATAVLGYCMGSLPGDFFLGKPNRFIITSFIDGLIFAMITAGVFAAMWPESGLADAPASIQP